MALERVDVLIAGGGPVGATLALALRESGLAVTLAEPRDAPTRVFRPLALSEGSRIALATLGVFDRIPATPIETIHVSQSGGFGRAVMQAAEHGLPALGYVADAAAIGAVLADALRHEARSEARIAGRVAAWRADAAVPGGVCVRIEAPEGAREVAARLLVLADGGGHGGDDLALRDYGQTALVAVVHTETIRRHTAFERFTPGGPLALLPFAARAAVAPGDAPVHDAYALVWTLATHDAERLANAGDAVFLGELGERFGRRLGRFAGVGPRVAHPLRLWFRRSSVVAPRVVAIGNAAQALHPVAGQGLNLGLRDAVELAAAARRAARSALGNGEFLAAFAAARRIDRYATIGVTDALVRLFGADWAPLRIARGIGLAALDALPPARRELARRMMLGLRAAG